MLRPVGFTVEFLYNCPHCHSQTWASDKEVDKLGRAICWSCEAILEFEPVTMIPQYGGKQKTPNGHVRAAPPPPDQVVQPKDQQAVDALVATLKGLGHRAREAKALVEGGVQRGLDPNNPEHFLQKIMFNESSG